jgi:CspA family cold shock protein
VLTTAYCDFLARRGTKVKMPVLCMACFLRTGPWPKQQGQVKWFSSRKCYGFIVTGEGQELFFHQQQLLEDQETQPQEGQKVLFHARDTAKGPEALNVELVQ